MIEIYKLHTFTKGWFIGNFDPSLYKTNYVEIGLKTYKAGEIEDYHHHKIATEYTVIINGVAEMSGKKYVKGDIIVIKPGESTDFKAVTTVTTMVVKIPGANNDKYSDSKKIEND